MPRPYACHILQPYLIDDSHAMSLSCNPLWCCAQAIVVIGKVDDFSIGYFFKQVHLT